MGEVARAAQFVGLCDVRGRSENEGDEWGKGREEAMLMMRRGKKVNVSNGVNGNTEGREGSEELRERGRF